VYFHVPVNKVSDIRMKVFTLAFRKVRDDYFPNQGPNEVDLPILLTDKWGTKLANGVYYVEVITTQKVWNSKLLILR